MILSITAKGKSLPYNQGVSSAGFGVDLYRREPGKGEKEGKG